LTNSCTLAGPLRLRAGLFQRRFQDAAIDRIAAALGAPEHIERAGGVAGDRRQRLVQFMRQHRGDLAHRRQARRGLQLFVLLAVQFFDALAVRDVEDGTHPAGLLAVLVDQRRFKHQHRHAFAVGTLEEGLELRRRLARQDVGEAALVFGHRFRRPIGHRWQLADNLLGRIADDLAERRIHVGDAAFEVACAQAGDQRILHRGAERHLLAQRAFGRQPP
jgi:hypothetical protein